MLINRTLFTRSSIETLAQFYQRVKTWIAHNYTYQHLYLYGDGASWIMTCANVLQATFVLDLYHTKQAINRLSSLKSVRAFATKLLLENNHSAFMHFHNALIEMQYPLTKMSHLSFDYLVKHWDHIQLNFSLPKSVGCSQERNNFHYFASRLMTFPRGWSDTNLRVIACLLTLVHNSQSLKQLQDILAPTIHSLETVSKTATLGPHSKYFVIESLSDNHQFHKQAYLHF